jgi:hypothetical protein
MEKQLLEDVISSGSQPISADKRATRESFLVVVQKIDDDIGELCG